MVASQLIENKVNSIEPTKVFTIEDLGFPADWWENVRVKLGRMVKSGQLEKAGRGKYYKSKASIFGKVGPDQSEIVKDLLYDNNILSGYITGYSIWNDMGLTTQIASVIIIGTSRRRDPMKRGIYRIKFVTQLNRITSENIPMLQILDAIKMIKQIPDTTVDNSVSIIRAIISRLDDKAISLLIKLSMKYPPRVRAVLGAILESLYNDGYTKLLKETLNPMTSFSIGITTTSGLNLRNWQIE